MISPSRNSTYKNSIKISKKDYDLAVKRIKKLTIRLGEKRVDESVKSLTDGKRSLPVEITKVRYILFENLTDEHAKDEGMNNIQELAKDLARYYGVIKPNQKITLIYFSPGIEQLSLI